MNQDFIYLWNEKLVHGFYFKAVAVFHDVGVDGNPEFVIELSSVDIETALICFEGDTVLYFGPKHHLITGHVIVHDIFQHRPERLFADEVEPDFVVGRDLNPLVAANIID